jgi:hypothetical protein
MADRNSICISTTPTDLARLDLLKAVHGTTRSGVIRQLVREAAEKAAREIVTIEKSNGEGDDR